MKTRIKSAIKEFIRRDKYVAVNRKEEIMKSQLRIAIIAAVGFFIMSCLNWKIGNDRMLFSTAAGSVIMIVAYILGKVTKNDWALKVGFMFMLILVFPMYVITGANNGFACLWLCVVTYLVLYFIDFLIGLLVNFFYFALLLLSFYSDLFKGVSFFNLDVVGYNDTFKMRFPWFFLINFAFAVYFVANSRNAQYELIKSRERFEYLSKVDLNTGLLNRNAFIGSLPSFNPASVDSLTVIFIDANGLHELNNEKGHAAGDLFLKTVADHCKQFFPDDLVYRMGGDEFLIVAKDILMSEAMERMESIRKRLKENEYYISYGVEHQTDNMDLLKMAEKANKLMLKEKEKYYKELGKTPRHSS